MPRGLSLHIGLDTVDPAHYDGWEGALNACEFDARDMQALAETRGFEPTLLLTREATADAVVGVIDGAARQLQAGDILFLTCSGHGGQVPDTNGGGYADNTWLMYDRQLVDDELYALWAKFEPGVRILILSDNSHSGTVMREIDDAFVERVASAERVSTAERAAAQNPRFRALPRDKMITTYQQSNELYDRIQEQVPSSTSSASALAATVLLISGCRDGQLSRDGVRNGRFTEELLKVWGDGAWQGNYGAFHEAILAGMPDDQQPDYSLVGVANRAFEEQEPFMV
jgi:metacaspase-1